MLSIYLSIIYIYIYILHLEAAALQAGAAEGDAGGLGPLLEAAALQAGAAEGGLGPLPHPERPGCSTDPPKNPEVQPHLPNQGLAHHLAVQPLSP